MVIAFGAIRRNALRGVLTAFGILIGVAAVTIVVALSEGAERAISERIDSMGQNTLTVTPRESASSGVRDDDLPDLTEGDARAIGSEVDGVAASAPVLDGFSLVAYEDANTSAMLVGTTLEYFEARSWDLASGSPWNPSSEVVGERVCVVGQTIKQELFGVEDPVGRTLRIGRYPFRILGVLAEKGQTPFGQDQDNVIVMPIVTKRGKLSPTRPGGVSNILISANSGASMDRVRDQATALLRQRHSLEEGAESDFRIRGQDEFRATQQRIVGVLQTLLLSVATVSLVIGGIGIMNIMLVSVAERTYEIGIRMAIGAKENDILLQFLVEAVALSVLGGAAGAGLAAIAVHLLQSALDWPMSVSSVARTENAVPSGATGTG
jgi:putative ABC transport system permease protein